MEENHHRIEHRFQVDEVYFGGEAKEKVLRSLRVCLWKELFDAHSF